jgi:hypothetical protein
MSAKCQQRTSALFNHLAGTREQRGRHSEAERLGGLEVDCQLVLGRRLNRHVSRLFTFKDSIDVAGRASVLVEQIDPIGYQTTISHEEPIEVDRG